jgi:hypothetical protein
MSKKERINKGIPTNMNKTNHTVSQESALVSRIANARTMRKMNVEPSLTADARIVRLTMRLSDAGMRRLKTKLIYPNHRPPLLGPPKDTARDRSNRLLAVICAIANTQDVCGYVQPRR